jgi:hypothetical protein
MSEREKGKNCILSKTTIVMAQGPFNMIPEMNLYWTIDVVKQAKARKG